MIKNYLVPVLLMSACSTSYQPPHTYNEILVINNSRESIQNVTISVAASGRAFSCGNIAPLGICSNRMPTRRYESEPIRIDWVMSANARRTDEFVVPVPITFTPGIPLRSVLDINEAGEISAYFQQETSFR